MGTSGLVTWGLGDSKATFTLRRHGDFRTDDLGTCNIYTPASWDSGLGDLGPCRTMDWVGTW